ncbi:MAG: hypothetical protein DWQ04_06655 [Chloroflexi bacterium]|nr:MAG: hypothetical protein DWQ04_06655 [Chloroflexota bacterium]
MNRYFFLVIFLLLLFSSGCSQNAGSVNLSLNETSAEISEMTEEVIRMNNCGGKAESEQVATRSRTIYTEGSGSLGVDGQVIKGEVSAKYGESNNISKSQRLVSPPGTRMQFVLRWTEKTWIGIVTAQGEDEQANYKVSVPVSVELISSKDLGCDTNVDNKTSELIAGNWKGTIQGKVDEFTADIFIMIEDNCEIDAICGTYSVPSLPCSGNLKLGRIDDDTFIFVEQKTNGEDWCGSGDFEYIKPLSNDTLSWEYKNPTDNIESTAILKRDE